MDTVEKKQWLLFFTDNTRQYKSWTLLQVCLHFQPYMGPQCIISRVLLSLEMSSDWEGKWIDYGSRSRGRKAKAAPSCTSHSPGAALFPSREGEKLFALNSRGKSGHCHALLQSLNEQHSRNRVNKSTSSILFAEVLKQVWAPMWLNSASGKHNFASICSILPALQKNQSL